MSPYNVQYLSDEKGNPISVIVPIEQWNMMLSKYEVASSLQQSPSIAELFDELEAIEENTDLEITARCNRLNPMEYF